MKNRAFTVKSIVVKFAFLLLSIQLCYAQTTLIQFRGNQITTTEEATGSTNIGGQKVFSFSENTPRFSSLNSQQQFSLGAKISIASSFQFMRLSSPSEGFEPARFTFSCDPGPSSVVGLLLTAYWPKSLFLSSNPIRFDNNAANSIIFFNTNSVDGINIGNREFRFIVKNGSTFYVSEFSSSDDGTGSISIAGFNNTNWMAFDPTSLTMPVVIGSPIDFNDVQGVGFIFQGSHQYGRTFRMNGFTVKGVAAPPLVSLSGINIVGDAEMTVTGVSSYVATVSPANAATPIGINWTVDDPSKAYVDAKMGNIVALKAGTITLTATASNPVNIVNNTKTILIAPLSIQTGTITIPGPIITVTGPTVTVTSSITIPGITQIVTVTGPCSITGISIGREKFEESIEVYPNPGSGLYKLTGNIANVYKSEVYTLKGVKVAESINSNSVDITSLINGSYIFVYKDFNGDYLGKTLILKE